jgi:hypothetical protein
MSVQSLASREHSSVVVDDDDDDNAANKHGNRHSAQQWRFGRVHVPSNADDEAPAVFARFSPPLLGHKWSTVCRSDEHTVRIQLPRPLDAHGRPRSDDDGSRPSSRSGSRPGSRPGSAGTAWQGSLGGRPGSAGRSRPSSPVRTRLASGAPSSYVFRFDKVFKPSAREADMGASVVTPLVDDVFFDGVDASILLTGIPVRTIQRVSCLCRGVSFF